MLACMVELKGKVKSLQCGQFLSQVKITAMGFLGHPKWALLTIQNRLPNLSYSLHLGGESHIL